MVSFNRVTLARNLTRDPELTFTSGGIPVCNTGIAVNRVRSKNEEVDFFDLTIWREAGETIANYKKKGAPILIEGRLQFRQWESNEGERRSKVDVVVDSFQFLSRGTGSETAARMETSEPGRGNPGRELEPEARATTAPPPNSMKASGRTSRLPTGIIGAP